MNKATDRSKKMRAMFGGVDPAELAKSPNPAPSMTATTKQRVSSGAIKSMRNTFSDVEKENEKLRQMIEDGSVAHELSTDDLDPSFVADRMVVANDEDFEKLKRPSLPAVSRYQFWCVRIRKLRAVIRSLSVTVVGAPVKTLVCLFAASSKSFPMKPF